MCGFVLSIGDVDQNEVRKATNEIRYRGPDDTNYFMDPDKKIYVGHNRLSIMDHEFGKQPLISSNREIIIAYNGEIYNQFELRKELEDRKVKFKSKSSDTEVVLKGYEFWGDKIFQKIDGQFAIVIIDLSKNILLLGRDKFGEKPLFYYIDNEKIIIGSELKIFKHFSNLNLRINETGVKKFFIYSFIPAPTTIYKNIFKVKHSEHIKIDLKRKNIVKNIYYKPKIIKNYSHKEKDFVEELDFLMEESVKSRLLSDDKIGVFLSGGLDSSLISSYAKKHINSVESYSISVQHQSFDEIDQAKNMSSLLDLKMFFTNLNEDKFKNEFDKIIKLLDEPIGAPTLIPMYFLSKLTSQRVKSVLSGDGADEIFGGYENFNFIKVFRYINFLKLNKMISKTKNIFDFLPISKNNLSIDFKLRRFCQGMEVDEKFQNTFFLSSLSLKNYQELFNEKFNFEELLNEVDDFNNSFPDANFIDRNYLYFINFYIPDLICARADKSGMLNSLEIRSPYLNPKILELMLSIPENKHYLIKGKRILKLLAQKKLNFDFFKVKKGGFTYPMQSWLNASQINPTTNMNKDKFFQMKLDHYNKKREYRNFFHCCKVIQNYY
mgnify:CR=1 FL=1